MNTPAHLIFGLATFGKPGAAMITAAALAGAIIPDLSLYLLAGWHLFVLETPPEVVFGELYYSEEWQAIFRIDNSIVLWAIALIVAMMAGARWGIALAGAALLHLAFDFPLHNDDARAHFWPITNWKFVSPVSYWDPNHYGLFVAPVEVGLVIAGGILIWRRFRNRWLTALAGVLVTMQTVPAVAFALMMG